MKKSAYIPLALLAAVFSMIAVAAASSVIAGTFALQGSVPQTVGYLSAQQIGNDPLDRRLDIWMTKSGSTVPIRAYDVDMTKYLHLVIVNDNFTMFLHLHPTLQPDGHFVIKQRLPFAGVFHLYADGEPHGFGQQVFRFDLSLGHPTYFEPAAVASAEQTQAPPGTITITRDASERHTVAHSSGYTVRLSSNQLPAETEAMIAIHILKNGKPASDLHPYLGALAHAVFLNAYDLSYVHAHPMPFSSGNMSPGSMYPENMKPLPANAHISPNMMLHVFLNEPGIYKLWLQFRGGSQLIVVPFVITAGQP